MTAPLPPVAAVCWRHVQQPATLLTPLEPLNRFHQPVLVLVHVLIQVLVLVPVPVLVLVLVPVRDLARCIGAHAHFLLDLLVNLVLNFVLRLSATAPPADHGHTAQCEQLVSDHDDQT